MNRIIISPAVKFQGDFQIPGDKSISHRSALIASICSGQSRIYNYSSARDCASTLDCMRLLGVETIRNDKEIIIKGAGLNGLSESGSTLDAGNSGSTIRMLSGILAGQDFTTTITGDESIRRRPMKRIIDPLSLMGAEIEAKDSSFAPLRIKGGNLTAMRYRPPVASAQVKSCILLAGLFADGKTSVIENIPTRNHTEIMLVECGVDIQFKSSADGHCISINGKQALEPLGNYTVAGDLSSAAFFIVSALITPEAKIRLQHIGINPSRTALIDVLKMIGGQIEIENPRIAHGEPVGDIVACSSSLSGNLELSGSIIANLIDEIPILAVAATQLDGTLTVSDAAELRVKESDRIQAIVDNLRQMSIEVDEREDGFTISGKQRLKGNEINSFDDHRIAMAFAVAGLAADGETVINGSDAASVSLPEFYSLLSDCGVALR